MMVRRSSVPTHCSRFWNSDKDTSEAANVVVRRRPSQDDRYRHRRGCETIERSRHLLLAASETRPDGSALTFSTEFCSCTRSTS